MAIYPFYTSIKTPTREVGAGCRSKDGELITTIFQREHGAITTAFKVVQTTYYNEKTKVRTLVCVVKDTEGNEVARKETIY